MLDVSDANIRQMRRALSGRARALGVRTHAGRGRAAMTATRRKVCAVRLNVTRLQDKGVLTKSHMSYVLVTILPY